MPTYDDRAAQALLARSRRIANLLDTRWRLPGTGIRFGLDPVIGLLPIVGDTATLLVGAIILVDAGRVGAPFRLRARMALNLLIDWAIGIVPIIGAVFDTAFRCNVRNVRLLECSLGIEPESSDERLRGEAER